MTKRVNKNGLQHKIVKGSKPDKMVCPAGRWRREEAHRGNDFYFKGEEEKTKKNQKPRAGD